ncbi:MAG TPA: OadG family protein [Clostridiales bacterium]|nr:OadG family protein [Clostridiales bacterium]
MGSILVSQAMLSGGLSSYITLNTLFGAVVVLAVVVLLMLITYFVNIKPNLKDDPTEAPSPASNAVANTIAQIEKSEEVELASDCELVAVITAAIYASMGDAVPKDGFVVRSIRRVNNKKWMNA